MLMGKEKSEDFARNSLPSNRWELFWDIFKGSFWKLVLVNLLILLFFIPLLFLFYFRSSLESSYSALYPYAQMFGVGYQAPVSMQGFSQSINFSSNLLAYLLMPIAMMVAAVGISGGAYLIRNMVWTEGVFVSNDFWKGIKQNYKQIVVISLLYSLVFYVTMITASYASYSTYNILPGSGGFTWLFYVCEILSYVILVYYTLMTLYMITLAVTYELTIPQLIKNSFYLTLAFLPHSILFGALASIPFVLFAISGSSATSLMITLLLVLVLGFSYAMLLWTNYSQWTFDNFINDRVPGARKNRGIYQKTPKQSDEKSKLQYKAQYVTRIGLNSRPIKPIDDDIEITELPTSFTREDLLKLRESKEKMVEDHNRYVEEHKDDEQFQKTEAEIAKEEAEKERLKKIEKAKKALRKYEKRKKN